MTTTASAQHLTDFQAVVMLAEDAERGGLIEIYDRTWMKRLEGEYVVALSARLTGEGKQYLARLRRKMQ
ncbi:MAG: hypothetical protein HYR85_25065 [Planctomycetes bacterium]|nr:hypothetical protein [Planctomycetota bacterium]MBI3843288.1 hypothetical protein [Planctomycetota bacterium]